jgi:predicted enzyme related to lactoylglutathione lyase
MGYTYTDENVDYDDREEDYRVLRQGDTPRAGLMLNPFEGVQPVWVNYIRVEDPAAITARVESLGGRILVDAQPRDIGGTVAFVAGPSGAGIAVQTWPLTEQ